MSPDIPRLTSTPERFLPKDSRKFLIQFIKNYGRDDNPDLPPQPVPIVLIHQVENQRGLYFGPNTDAMVFIHAQDVLKSTLRIDGQNNTVTYVGKHRSGGVKP